MELVGFVVYVLVCGAIAWLLAKVLTRRAREPWVRWAVAGVLAPVVFLLPFADEIVGHFQFERLCAEAKDVKIYGTIPVGEDLYTPEGKWRLGLVGAADFLLPRQQREGFRLHNIAESYLRREYRRLPDIHAAIEIHPNEWKFFDAKSGRLLAEYRSYGTNGGWVGRNVVAGEGTLVVRQSCSPENAGEIKQMLLKFTKPSEATK